MTDLYFFCAQLKCWLFIYWYTFFKLLVRQQTKKKEKIPRWVTEVTGHLIAISNWIQKSILVTKTKNDSDQVFNPSELPACIIAACVSFLAGFPDSHVVLCSCKVYVSHRFVCQFLEEFIFSSFYPSSFPEMQYQLLPLVFINKKFDFPHHFHGDIIHYNHWKSFLI